MTETVPILSGYQMTEKLYDGTRTLIYRALRETDSQRVVIKFLKNEYPTFNELVQFRNQYTIAKNLDIDGIVHPYALETYHNGFAFIMEEVEAISLYEYITDNPLTLKDFFNVAIVIVKTLEALYQNRVIHKDIKPQNILIHPETQQIKLIDFSISSLLPRETQEIQSPNVLEGTLAYLSPEQTGRMNRGIDYRTDFYSLGVTFYELLTGQLPFQSDDPMELVHCHIAQTPTPPMQVNATIPSVVNDLILKLMAKTTEERYQSAFGIRYDLEQCQQQWQAHESITPFKLGQRDISDRFQIPEKLYGRETEVAALLAAFDRVSKGQTEMMLVAGFSGIGKTALVNEVHKPIVRQRGYFIKGKFDQFKRDIPFSALVQAFQTLMQQLVTESATQVQGWKTQILAALGENGQVIIDVIPELEQIIRQQPPVQELEGSAAQNRFNLLLQKFIKVFTTAEHPLVIFLDDLQWIDSASLKLMQLLMEQTDSHYLLLMGAYRDNEVNAAHPFILILEDIRKTDALVNQITLGPLAQPELNRLIADTLSCPVEKANPLTELVSQKTQGNPFFTNQFLKFLHEEQLMIFNFDCGYWQCDIAQVKLLTVSDDVVEFMALQLQKLPIHTQNVLKMAACIGNQFNLATLSIVLEKSQADTAADLWKALQEGLIIPVSDVYKFFQATDSNEALEVQTLSVPYRFLHDRVQQAAYSLIPEAQKAITHLQIGQLLKSHTPEEELDENIFDIVNQMNQGIDLISVQTERDELAQLNLQAGRKAKASTAYTAANQYLIVGLKLLSPESWQTHYDLTLALYEASAEVAYLNGDFSRQEQLVETVLLRAKSLLDKVKVYKIQVSAYMAQSKQREAVKSVLRVVKLLGITFPEEPSPEDTMRGLQETQALLAEKPIASLCELPSMTEPEQLAALQLLSSVLAAAYQATPQLLPLMVFKPVQLSVNYGNAPESIFVYAMYGLLINAMEGNIEVGYQFGQLASNLLERLNAKKLTALKCVSTDTVAIWKIHVRDTLKVLLDGYQTGLEVGDLENGTACVYHYCRHSYFAGNELPELKQEMAIYSEAIGQLKQKPILNFNNITRQTVLNLMGQSENPCHLVGEAFNEENILPQLQQANDGFGIANLYIQKMSLGYLFQDNVQALENAILAEQYLAAVAGILWVAIFHFYDSLIRLAVYPDTEESEQPALLEKVAANQEKMQTWAKHAPMNFQHKFDLIEAERHRILDKNVEAMDFFDNAIAGAKENEYLNEEALANEVAARFYLGWGKEKVAQTYMREAYYCYARWGAKAKVDDLEKRYPQLLAAILTPSETPSLTATMSTSSKTVLATSMATSSILDFATVIKASQAISDERDFEQLIQKMMQLVMENVGAERGVLILEKQGQFWLEAEARLEKECKVTLQSLPIDKASEQLLVSSAVINTVLRNKTPLVLNDATHEETLVNDPYILKKQPKSVLGQPILYHGELTGVLYLENNLMSNAFTSDRLVVLKLLATQMAISLENAQIVANLDAKVVERTVQLNDKIEELTHTRNELVQSEKMASLGRLVAGFAHELNTPIGVAVGTASTGQKKMKSILQLLDEEEVDEEELVSGLERLDEMAELTLSNLDRAANLVSSFKRTAIDQTSDEVRHFKVKRAIVDVMNTLQNHFKQTAIEFQVDCSDDIAVYSIAGAFEQILTNLIMNSLIHGFSEGKDSGSINIMAQLEKDNLHFEYSDTGKGIASENLEKIFEPFFTTHRAHGGSGIGLYICYNLITSQLNGTITCDSAVGKGVRFMIDFPVQTAFVKS
ncbi:ATP-binding sensor histidine kinase [Candidatus Parabeggiatoa sp. HSG14]|uniref:trifunctional serine/threonine-protein kinase/ATP-binding protein/sensor histidine kinase n=1 Tax=Candidatus Parabeggiatoa sp. HSG14 TaxID=3055593 RepID=UPI0025A77910|nr:ATP-binding sensor histidine kinase [Thiotrichales bacterium HSG14]